MRSVHAVAIITLVIFQAFVGWAEQQTMTDAELAEYIEGFARLRHSCEPLFAGLIEDCQFDSNRLCRVAKDVFRRHDEYRTQLVALKVVDRFGDARQVPFWESCVTNIHHGSMAILVLNDIEGFTSNSVLRTARYHSVTNQEVRSTDKMVYSDRMFALERLVLAATRPGVPADLWNLTCGYAYSFASNNCYSIGMVDRELAKLDPTFVNSKRRLALLRYAQPRARLPHVLQYLAREIRKLEEYPEENLPE